MSRSDDIRNIIEGDFGRPWPIDETAMGLVRKRLDSIAKPLDGLGDFEEILVKIGGIAGSDRINIKKRAVIVMCADNGIVEENVSQVDSSVTRDVAKLMSEQISSVGIMSGVAGCDTFPINIGIKGEKIPGLIDMKIADGTADFLKRPAMTKRDPKRKLQKLPKNPKALKTLRNFSTTRTKRSDQDNIKRPRAMLCGVFLCSS